VLIRLSTPRLIAMLAVGFLLGWWSAHTDPATLAEYRALSHDALLTKLAERHDGDLGTNTMGATVVIFMIVGAVELATRVVERVAAVVSRRDARGAPAASSASDAGP